MRRQRIIGLLKSVLVLLLLVLLLLQFLTYWLMGTNIATASSDGILRTLYTRFHRGAAGYEIRVSGVSAVEPVQVALMTAQGGNGAQYNKAEISMSILALQSVTSSAFLNAESFSSLEEDVLLEMLTTDDSVILHYFYAAPLRAIASGLQTESSSDIEAVSVMLFVQEQCMVVRDREGMLFAADTQIDRQTFDEVKSEFRFLGCQIAGADYLVTPESLLFEEESIKFPVIGTTTIDPLGADSDASLERLLEAFSYTSRAGLYKEKNDSVYVYTDQYSTLRLTNEGQISFRASKEQSTIVAYEAGKGTQAKVLTAQISTAYAILETALGAIGSEAQPVLAGTSQEADGATRITFRQSYDGVPVMEPTEFASFVFYDDVLGAATVNLSLLSVREDMETVTVFPARQAAASASQQNQRMVIAYCGTQDAFTAQRYFAQ